MKVPEFTIIMGPLLHYFLQAAHRRQTSPTGFSVHLTLIALDIFQICFLTLTWLLLTSLLINLGIFPFFPLKYPNTVVGTMSSNTTAAANTNNNDNSDLPNVPAACLFAVLFFLVTMVHTYQLFRTRTWWLLPFLIGGYCKRFPLNELRWLPNGSCSGVDWLHKPRFDSIPKYIYESDSWYSECAVYLNCSSLVRGINLHCVWPHNYPCGWTPSILHQTKMAYCDFCL